MIGAAASPPPPLVIYPQRRRRGWRVGSRARLGRTRPTGLSAGAKGASVPRRRRRADQQTPEPKMNPRDAKETFFCFARVTTTSQPTCGGNQSHSDMCLCLLHVVARQFSRARRKQDEEEEHAIRLTLWLSPVAETRRSRADCLEPSRRCRERSRERQASKKVNKFVAPKTTTTPATLLLPLPSPRGQQASFCSGKVRWQLRGRSLVGLRWPRRRRSLSSNSRCRNATAAADGAEKPLFVCRVAMAVAVVALCGGAARRAEIRTGALAPQQRFHCVCGASSARLGTSGPPSPLASLGKQRRCCRPNVGRQQVGARVSEVMQRTARLSGHLSGRERTLQPRRVCRPFASPKAVARDATSGIVPLAVSRREGPNLNARTRPAEAYQIVRIGARRYISSVSLARAARVPSRASPPRPAAFRFFLSPRAL